MPRKSQTVRILPPPVPRDRGRCPACWKMHPVDGSGTITSHLVHARYEGRSPLIDCPGAGQQPAGRVVHDSGRSF